MAEIKIEEGSRCLLSIKNDRWALPTVEEYKVLEYSPSGNWIRLMNTNGRKFWIAIVSVSFVEQLRSLSEGRPKDEQPSG